MLIGQDSNCAAAPQQFNRFLKTFVAIEQLDAGTAAQAANVFVDVTIF